MPSLVSGFEYDIFISYRQKDNRYDGWVTEFVQNLRKELDATLKEEVSIYFDENPHDGLLETHHVEESLKRKLKCLIFIPILSRTYCDPKSYAWTNEFLVFRDQVREDQFGPTVILRNGNAANRILPVRIHELDNPDKALFEKETGSPLRAVDFVFKAPGVNRPLRAKDDDLKEISHLLFYRDQINKIANGCKELFDGLRIDRQAPAQLPEKQKAQPVMRIPEPKQSTGKRGTARIFRLIVLGLIGVTALLLGYFQVMNWRTKEVARNVYLPELRGLIEKHAFQLETGGTIGDGGVYDLAIKVRKALGDDQEIVKLWPHATRRVRMVTEPPGARVSWKRYEEPVGNFREVGLTPIDSFSVPNDLVVIRIEKEAFKPKFIASLMPINSELSFELEPEGENHGMVSVPNGTTNLPIVGFSLDEQVQVPKFHMDELEVTNIEYKRFIDAGGYTDEIFWKIAFESDGIPRTKAEARKLFVDQTGRLGPSTWEAGRYPDGQEGYPVSGISWYEAAAYCAYAGKSLPSVYHWSRSAHTVLFTNKIISKSNFNGTGTVEAGTLNGINRWGSYDLAGNVREWCFNAVPGTNQRYILGGAWNDHDYNYNEAFWLPAINRSPGNGVRCIRKDGEDSAYQRLLEPVGLVLRDYAEETPISASDFKFLLTHFEYDTLPFNAVVSESIETTWFRVERIEIDAAYAGERQIAYLYLPTDSDPPYQTVFYWPGSGAINRGPFSPREIEQFDFLPKTGRAVLYPVFKGTFERSDGLKSSSQDQTVRYREYATSWIQDTRRLLDYLDTRNDINHEAYGYFGYSWGGAMAPVALAVEPRFKAAVLHVGGLRMQPTLPEVDPINFAPYVNVPVLMLNGRNDAVFPYEASQKPMLRFLGTPDDKKKLMSFEGGHLVPKSELVRETVNWLDLYLK